MGLAVLEKQDSELDGSLPWSRVAVLGQFLTSLLNSLLYHNYTLI